MIVLKKSGCLNGLLKCSGVSLQILVGRFKTKKLDKVLTYHRTVKTFSPIINVNSSYNNLIAVCTVL